MKESKHIQLNEAKWDKWAGYLDSEGWRYEYLRKAQQSVIALLESKENMNFLDIGCGTGWAMGKAAELVAGRGMFYGVDLSPKMIEKAKENFKGRDNFHFIKANSASIPLENSLFDSIICTNSFHHYLHPEKALGEIYRLLKSGGKIYILDPTADIWLVKVADKLIKLWEPGHVKIYSTEEFKRLIVGSGLKYVGCERISATQKIHIGEK